MYDAIIIGLGAMGSATAWQLARRGASVLGLDQFARGHARGSSHGRTRVIRRVYAEGGLYMPLLGRAYQLWAEMEAASGQEFLVQTGGLDLGPAGSLLVAQAESAALSWNIVHERLSARAIMARFPALALPDSYEGVLAPQSGLLRSDAANDWMRAEAESLGADLRWECTVTGWRHEGANYRIDTPTGPETARRLVIAAGPWTGLLCPQVDAALAVERQVVAWFNPLKDLPGLPVFQADPADGARPYVMPPLDGAGIKIGVYGHFGERGPSMREGRVPDARDAALLRDSLDRFLPGTAGRLETMMDCRFTRTRDDRFLIGPLPGDGGVTLLAPCSGHGYKFAPAIGEAAADLVLDRAPDVDLEPFAVPRVQ